jgi:ABC-type ATPase involved in cell division
MVVHTQLGIIVAQWFVNLPYLIRVMWSSFAMMYQDLMLFPHMTIKENILFSVKIRKTGGDDIEKKVTELVDILGIRQVNLKVSSHIPAPRMLLRYMGQKISSGENQLPKEQVQS